MSPSELQHHEGPYQLIDVRLAEDFQGAHIKGAKNNCVFEVSFISRLEESAPDKTMATIIYGANDSSKEAEAAAEKLRRENYTDIHILEGGIESVATSEIELGEPIPPDPIIEDGCYEIDLSESKLEWLGRNLLNKHWGSVSFIKGHITYKSGKLVSGEWHVDMKSLVSHDLAGTDLHDVLIAHLENDDFFDVENYPTCKFVLKSCNQLTSSKGSRNYAIKGEFTLKGVMQLIAFEAAFGLDENGCPAAQASFSIDRTRWGVLYGSGKYFKRLAGHLVNDDIEFQIRLVTKRAQE